MMRSHSPQRHWIRAFGVTVALLLTVYVPTFALVAYLHLPMANAIPVIIVVSTMIALSLMWARRHSSMALHLANFGFRWCRWQSAIVAVLIALPLAWLVNTLLTFAHEPGPLAGVVLTPVIAWIYFGLGSPLQEELIFRGLLQTTFAHSLTNPVPVMAQANIAALVIAALLFASVHLAVGPWTALAALVLGLLAGELRRRSGSLIPAVLVHIIFNIPGLLAAIP